MSYIRCLSNPERLYIVSDGKKVNVSHKVQKPHSSGREFDIPSRTFEGLCRKWAKEWEEPVAYRGASVEEIHVNRKTGRIIPAAKPCKKGCKPEGNGWVPCKRCFRKSIQDARRGDFLVRLSFGRDFVNMWRVTWHYIAGNANS